MNQRIKLELPKEENFHLEQGVDTYEVKDVFLVDEPKGETEQSIRIKWRRLNSTDPNVEDVVAKSYPYSLAKHSALRKDLEKWSGPDIIQRLTVNGEVHLHLIIGRTGRHRDDTDPQSRSQETVCVPYRIAPAGSLTGNQQAIDAPCIAPFKKLVR